MDTSQSQSHIKKIVLKHMDEMVTELEGEFGRMIMSNPDVKAYNAAVTRLILVFTKTVLRIL
jgi:hypothetical protein